MTENDLLIDKNWNNIRKTLNLVFNRDWAVWKKYEQSIYCFFCNQIIEIHELEKIREHGYSHYERAKKLVIFK